MTKIYFTLFACWHLSSGLAQIKTKAEDDIFVTVEENPQFPGGNKAIYQFIDDNLKYPKKAQENNTQGKVFVRIVIEKDGSIGKAEIIKGIGDGCDEEAILLVKNMPRWKPGQQNGHPVRVYFTLPIIFGPSVKQRLSQDYKDNSTSQSSDSTIFTTVNYAPHYPEGEEVMHQFIGKNLHFPEELLELKKDISIRVKVVVEKNGSLTYISSSKPSDCLSCENEARRIVQLMPRWIPGTDNEKRPLRCYAFIPINLSWKEKRYYVTKPFKGWNGGGGTKVYYPQ